jgi:DNA polymerase IIIc chi subunit
MKRGNKSARVIFYQVQTPKQKLERICTRVAEHFEKQQPLLIVTDSEKSTDFINELLWKIPIESFLPHGKENELILISHRQGIPFGGHAIFNLTPHPILDSNYSLKTIYEFEDLTSQERSQAFQPKYRGYSGSGHSIVSL